MHDKLNHPRELSGLVPQQKEEVVPVPGMKYDGDKPRFDLLDSSFLEGTAAVLTFGAKKYAPHNWRSGIEYSRVISAAYRHLAAINRGEDYDPETGLKHAYHVACNMQFLSWMMNNKPEMDDRYFANPKR